MRGELGMMEMMEMMEMGMGRLTSSLILKTLDGSYKVC
jgi:hypothetical protein